MLEDSNSFLRDSSPEAVVKWLFDPFSEKDFFAKFYEKKVCLIKRNAPEYYHRILTLKQVDEVLSTFVLKKAAVGMANAENPIPASEYSSKGRIDPIQVAKHYGSGATVIFNQLQDLKPSLRYFCSKIGSYFSARMQTNIYLTPSKSKGFLPHWDTHDTYILQICGTKKWQIYESHIELPLRGQAFEKDNPEHKPGKVVQEFILQAGDMVYIPRGIMHSATSIDNESLHVTLGAIGHTWADLLVEMMANLSLSHPELRKNLPVSFANSKSVAKDLPDLLKEKIALVQKLADAPDIFDQFAQKFAEDNLAPFPKLLENSANSSKLQMHSWVQPRNGVDYKMIEDDDNLHLQAFGNQISLPKHVKKALERSLAMPKYQVKDLPNVLDDKGKKTLTKRLILEGLLEFV